MIIANDFLTLLVTELKNQDPTANTDPNAYVDQFVQVNSLQQLIQIEARTQQVQAVRSRPLPARKDSAVKKQYTRKPPCGQEEHHAIFCDGSYRSGVE